MGWGGSLGAEWAAYPSGGRPACRAVPGWRCAAVRGTTTASGGLGPCFALLRADSGDLGCNKRGLVTFWKCGHEGERGPARVNGLEPCGPGAWWPEPENDLLTPS